MPTTTRPSRIGLPRPLTAQEQRILTLLASGKTSPEIGVELKCASRTVTNHIHNILNKLGAANRAHAVSIGKDLGLFAA